MITFFCFVHYYKAENANWIEIRATKQHWTHVFSSLYSMNEEKSRNATKGGCSLIFFFFFFFKEKNTNRAWKKTMNAGARFLQTGGVIPGREKNDLWKKKRFSLLVAKWCLIIIIIIAYKYSLRRLKVETWMKSKSPFLSQGGLISIGVTFVPKGAWISRKVRWITRLFPFINRIIIIL